MQARRLRAISPQEAQKEGGYTPENFVDVWREINGGWDPEEEIWAYEFELVKR